MRKTLVFSLGAVALLTGCAGPASSARVNGPEEEKVVVQAHNEENRVRTYVERYQEAKSKAAEYRGYVAKAEGELDRLTNEIHATREQSTAKSRELQGLKDESKRIETEVATARQGLAVAQQELQRVQREAAEASKAAGGVTKISEAAKAIEPEAAKRREISTKLQQLKLSAPDKAQQIDDILKSIGND